MTKMAVEAQLAPYLNRFVILLRQNSVAKLEISCSNGKLNVNISHDMGLVEQATPHPPPSYKEVLKKNLKRSQINRLQKRAAERADKASKEAEEAEAETAKVTKYSNEIAEKVNVAAEEAPKARTEELKAVKCKKGKENVVDTSFVSKTEQLETNFEKLKSEFELLKLCQRNQTNKNVDKKIQETSFNVLKCNICKSTFQTGSGLKVHIDLEHPTQPVNEAELKCNHCIITCSDIDVMKKHILREHNFKCTQCQKVYKEECTLKTHTSHAHK